MVGSSSSNLIPHAHTFYKDIKLDLFANHRERESAIRFQSPNESDTTKFTAEKKMAIRKRDHKGLFSATIGIMRTDVFFFFLLIHMHIQTAAIYSVNGRVV